MGRARRIYPRQLPGAAWTGRIPDRQKCWIWFTPFGEVDECYTARVERKRCHFHPAFVSSDLAPATSRLPRSRGPGLAVCSMREDAATIEVAWILVTSLSF